VGRFVDLVRPGFLAIWASRNRQILPAGASIRRPATDRNYLIYIIFLPMRRNADAISPCSQGGSRGRLGAEHAGQRLDLLAGWVRFAAKLIRLWARAQPDDRERRDEHELGSRRHQRAAPAHHPVVRALARNGFSASPQLLSPHRRRPLPTWVRAFEDVMQLVKIASFAAHPSLSGEPDRAGGAAASTAGRAA